MTEKTKVEAELVFDSNAQQLFAGIKADLQTVAQKVSESKGAFKDFFTQFAAMTSANLLTPVISNMKHFAVGALEMATHVDEVEQSIAGMMAGMSPREWEVARGGAALLRREFDDLSIAIGGNRDELVQGHAALRTFLGGTDYAFEVASRNMDSLTTISRTTGFSVQELGGQFGKMAAGFVSMESPIFNMLKSTNIFSSDITKINSEWQKLTQEERVRRLEEAFGGIADNLGEAAPTMANLLESIKNSGNVFLESFGGAVLRELSDNVEGLKEALIEGGDEFEDFAEALGQDVGQAISEVVDELTEAIAYLREHGDEIKHDIIEAFQFAKDVFSFMVDNAGLLTAGFAALKLGPALAPGMMTFAKGAMGQDTDSMVGKAGGLAADLVKTLLSAKAQGGQRPGLDLDTAIGFGTAVNPVKNVLYQAGGIVPGLLGMVPPLWGAAAAVTALTAGFGYFMYEGHKLDQQHRKEIDELIRNEEKRSKTLEDLSRHEFEVQEEERKRLIELAEELGEKTASIRRLDEAGRDRREMRAQYVDPASVAAANLSEIAKAGDLDQTRAQQELAVTEMSRALAEAVKTGDTEVSKALLMILLENEKLKGAFMNTADTVSMGAESLKLSLKALEEMGHGSGFLSEFFKNELDREFAGKAPQTQVNINGAVFKIQQEFRDQDPDRIAVAFERRFTREAMSRVQASTSTPFGA